MEEKLITVTKTVSDKFPPDTVDISITAVGTAKKYAEAVVAAERKSADTFTALKEAGLSEVCTSGMNVSTQRDGGKVVGYRAARALELHFAFDGKRLGDALEALGKSDCEWRLAFSLKDRSSKRGELISRAVKAAQTEAGIIAEAAGVKLGGLYKAEYGSSDGDGARPMVMRAAYAGGDNGAVEPETITLTETVTCAWIIAD